MPDLIPVEGNPFNVNLVPVEGDPFALQGDVGAAMQQQNAVEAQRRATMSNLFHSTVGAPGTVAQPVMPQTPGMWSDEDEARRQATEAAAANWAPQQALNSIGSGMPMAERFGLGMAGGGIKAYHGSPYDFEKFDLSKIGTGEGAQAYGHGLYFAENPATAEAYKKALTGLNPNQLGSGKAEFGVNGVPMPSGISGHAALDTGQEMSLLLGTMKDHPDSTMIPYLKQNIERRIANNYAMVGEGSAGDDMRAMAKYYDEHVKNAKPEDVSHIAPGRTYEVNINADPEHFLDWDKPLNQQSPQVKQKIEEKWGRVMNAGDLGARRGMTGADFYSFLDRPGYEGAVSHLQEKLGIPGIRYLDQGSRGPSTIYNVGAPRSDFGPYSPFTNRADAQAHMDMLRRQGFHDAEIREQAQPQTSNYVVFNDKLIDIIKKYGLAGLVAGGASHFTTTPVEHNPFAAQQ